MSEMEALSTSTNSDNVEFSWARAFRDIGVHAINTGQFPFFCMFITALVILFKLPDTTISQIALDVFTNLKEYVITGYGLFCITLILVTFYIKALRKRHGDQIAKQNELIEQLKVDLRSKIGNQTTGETI